jgi:hypothetical protein
MGCPFGGLDFTEGLFKYFADESLGVIYGEWSFLEDAENAVESAVSVAAAPVGKYVAVNNTNKKNASPTPKPKPTPTPTPKPTQKKATSKKSTSKTTPTQASTPSLVLKKSTPAVVNKPAEVTKPAAVVPASSGSSKKCRPAALRKAAT